LNLGRSPRKDVTKRSKSVPDTFLHPFDTLWHPFLHPFDAVIATLGKYTEISIELEAGPLGHCGLGRQRDP
jgi:hypothetical protein